MNHHHTFFRRRGHLFFELPVIARMHCAAALVLCAPRAAAIRVILVFLRVVFFSQLGWKNQLPKPMLVLVPCTKFLPTIGDDYISNFRILKLGILTIALRLVCRGRVWYDPLLGWSM